MYIYKTQTWWYIKENTYISATLILAILSFSINSNNTWWSYVSVYHKQHSPFPADPEPYWAQLREVYSTSLD